LDLLSDSTKRQVCLHYGE